MTLDEVRGVASRCMDEIIECFKPGAKITLIVRTPGHDEGDFCLSSDSDEGVRAVVARRFKERA